jgi:hypothetical protein
MSTTSLGLNTTDGNAAEPRGDVTVAEGAADEGGGHL